MQPTTSLFYLSSPSPPLPFYMYLSSPPLLPLLSLSSPPLLHVPLLSLCSPLLPFYLSFPSPPPPLLPLLSLSTPSPSTSPFPLHPLPLSNCVSCCVLEMKLPLEKHPEPPPQVEWEACREKRSSCNPVALIHPT